MQPHGNQLQFYVSMTDKTFLLTYNLILLESLCCDCQRFDKAWNCNFVNKTNKRNPVHQLTVYTCLSMRQLVPMQTPCRKTSCRIQTLNLFATMQHCHQLSHCAAPFKNIHTWNCFKFSKFLRVFGLFSIYGFVPRFNLNDKVKPLHLFVKGLTMSSQGFCVQDLWGYTQNYFLKQKSTHRSTKTAHGFPFLRVRNMLMFRTFSSHLNQHLNGNLLRMHLFALIVALEQSVLLNLCAF